MNAIEMKIDFLSDWKIILHDELKNMGYNNISSISDPTQLSITYYNVLKKKISKAHRKVLISKEFKCPDNLQSGVDLIKEKSEKGEDIMPHLSKTILKLDYNDALLNDWGIYHFHLGTNTNASQFVERTGQLLFARVITDTIFFIDVMKHGNWTKQEIIEIIHNNWPKSIQQFKLDDDVELLYAPSDDDIKKLRRVNLNSTLQLKDGSIYMFSIGGGLTTSGESTQAVIFAIQSVKAVKHLEKYVKNDINHIKAIIEKDIPEILYPLHFKLAFKNNCAYFIELNNSILFKLWDEVNTKAAFKTELHTV